MRITLALTRQSLFQGIRQQEAAGGCGRTSAPEGRYDILKKYRDKFVAVWNQKVIEADENLKVLSIKVRKKTLNFLGMVQVL